MCLLCLFAASRKSRTSHPLQSDPGLDDPGMPLRGGGAGPSLLALELAGCFRSQSTEISSSVLRGRPSIFFAGALHTGDCFEGKQREPPMGFLFRLTHI